jgi:glucose/mannose-6-phosphate isomerase
MGGSGLAAHVVQSLFRDQLGVPFDVVHGYELPKTVGPKTLYIVVSYSGNTEEPLVTLPLAQQRGAKVLVITTGGKLADIATRQKIPAYIFSDDHNPCRQPRMGVGYNLTALLAILNRLGYVDITDGEFEIALRTIKQASQKFDLTKSEAGNPAKKIALGLKGSMPIVVGSEFLEGNAHIMSNQINENGKNFATYFIVPELNHHLLEGLENPGKWVKGICFFFLESQLYDERNRRRIAITRQIITRLSGQSISYKLSGQNRLAQVLESVCLGSYVSYYLAMLNQLNPTPIPWVDYFKKRLAKS